MRGVEGLLQCGQLQMEGDHVGQLSHYEGFFSILSRRKDALHYPDPESKHRAASRWLGGEDWTVLQCPGLGEGGDSLAVSWSWKGGDTRSGPGLGLGKGETYLQSAGLVWVGGDIPAVSRS